MNIADDCYLLMGASAAPSTSREASRPTAYATYKMNTRVLCKWLYIHVYV